MCQHILLKMQDSTCTKINTITAIGNSLNGLGFGANQPASSIDAVAANIQQCTTTELGVVTVIAGGIKREGKGDMRIADLTACAGCQHVLQILHTWMKTEHYCFHEENTRLLAGSNHFVAFGSSHSERLLA